MKKRLALLALLTTLGASASAQIFDNAFAPIETETPLSLNDISGDGVSGMLYGPIYVATFGNDINPGTRSAPMRTIQAAVLVAERLGRSVYSTHAIYNEQVIFGNFKSMYGRFSDNGSWTNVTIGVTEIRPNAATVASVNLGTSQDAFLQLYNVQLTAGVNATQPGESSVGLYVDKLEDHQSITLQKSLVFTKNGAPGADGANGTNGSTGSNGFAGNSNGNPGTGGNVTWNADGGNGGIGGTSSAVDGQDGHAGFVTGGAGGAGGNSGIFPQFVTNGAPGQNGGAGTNGVNGTKSLSTNLGLFGDGNDGGNGTVGKGGGGGGGGGALNATPGGGGGGGGAGGFVGSFGKGGKQAGHSFGMYIRQSSLLSDLTLRDSTLSASIGGKGGNGGASGLGGNGGTGGVGGVGAKNGGTGGNGGKGGEGGAGSGGNGGTAAAALSYMPLHETYTNTFLMSTGGGGGGFGGVNPNGNAPSGFPGSHEAYAEYGFNTPGPVLITDLPVITGCHVRALVAANSGQSADIIPDVATFPAGRNWIRTGTAMVGGSNGILFNSSNPQAFRFSPDAGFVGIQKLSITVKDVDTGLTVTGTGMIVVRNTFSGHIDLQDYVGSVSGKQATAEFFDANDIAIEDQPITINANGNYKGFSPTGFANKRCRIKVGHWLSQERLVNTNAGNITGINYSLLNGDVDGDDVVSIFDYVEQSNSFDKALGDSGFNADADLDGDDVVSIFDYIILSTNFDLSGPIG